MNILLPVFDFQKAYATSSTDSSFDALVPTVTEPTADGVVTLSGVATNNGQTYGKMLVIPYGAGADDSTFAMRIHGWQKISTLWIPVPILEVACVLSTVVGVTGASLVATDRIVDTMTETLAPDTAVFYSTTGNRVAWLTFDTMGFQKVEFSFDMTGATNGNALYKRF